mmetsp:Transcript_51335/g.164111  ORF Transcript_51335/g.164111 Transcript_51335/m.164111 type:complete len:425 (+) Transcript_51335:18-1292(+)
MYAMLVTNMSPRKRPTPAATSQGGLVGGPPRGLVLGGGRSRVRGLVHAAPHDDDVALPLPDHALGGVVLLAQVVPPLDQLHARGHVDEAGGPRPALPARGVDGDVPHHVVLVRLGRLRDRLGVRPLGEGARRGHLRQEQQGGLALGGLLEAVDDPGPRHEVRVGDVGPVRDVVHPPRELHAHRVADVREFAILEDHEVVLLRQRLQLRAQAGGPVRQHVHVRLEDTDVRAHLGSHRYELLGGVDVRRHGEVGLLALHQLEELLGDRVLRHARAGGVGEALGLGLGRGDGRLCGGPRAGLVGGDEVPHVLRDLLGDAVVLAQHDDDVGHGERGVEAHVVGLEVALPALLPVDQHHYVLYPEAHLLEGLHRLHHRHPARHQILHDQAHLSLGEGALDGLLGAVVLDLLAAHEHALLLPKSHARGDG